MVSVPVRDPADMTRTKAYAVRRIGRGLLQLSLTLKK